MHLFCPVIISGIKIFEHNHRFLSVFVSVTNQLHSWARRGYCSVAFARCQRRNLAAGPRLLISPTKPLSIALHTHQVQHSALLSINVPCLLTCDRESKVKYRIIPSLHK